MPPSLARGLRRQFVSACGLLAVLASGATAQDLTPSEQRGKQLYLTGKAAGPEVMALLGEGGAEVPAATLPCVGCHGFDGRGRPEGAVVPSDITWSNLTKPYEVSTATGRRRGPYTETSLNRALGLGLDAAGNRLQVVMPRYRLSHEQAADLIAYLKRIDHEKDPGVAATTLTLGTVLPADPATAALVERVIEGYFATVNSDGGLYGRTLHLATLPAARASRAGLAAFLAEAAPFALVAPAWESEGAALARFCNDERVPVVGPLRAEPPAQPAETRFVFYLQPGAADLVEALAREATAQPNRPGLLLVRSAASGGVELDEERLARLAALGVESVTLEAAGAESLVAKLGAKDVLLATGPAETLALLKARAARGGPGRLLAPIQVVAPVLAARGELAGRLRLALPEVPGDVGADAFAAFARLVGEPRPPAAQLAVARAALVAAVLTVQGLKSSGRELRRDGFVEVLDRIYGFETGLMRPLSFGRNRRLGTGGAYLLDFDLATGQPVGQAAWKPLGEG